MDWNTLISVIVGGTIGTVGSVVAPALSSWLNDKSQRKKLRSEKLAELIAVIFETDHWLEQCERTSIWGVGTVVGPNPLPKAIAIAAIHFPSLNLILDEMEVVMSRYQLWMIRAGQKRMAEKFDEIADGLEEARNPYAEKRNEVISTVRAFAKQEFGE